MRRFAVFLLAGLALLLGLAYLVLGNTSIALEGEGVRLTTDIAGTACHKRLSARFPFVRVTCDAN